MNECIALALWGAVRGGQRVMILQGAPRRGAAWLPAAGPRPDILTRWGLVPAQEPAALIARLQRRLDAVDGPIRAIADPEERWEAVQTLGRGDAAARAMCDPAQVEEECMIAAVAATAGTARSMSADVLVDAVVGAAGGGSPRAPAAGVPGGAAPTPAGGPPASVGNEEASAPVGSPVDAGATQPTGEGPGGKLPIDEEEARLAAAGKAQRRRQAILSRDRRAIERWTDVHCSPRMTGPGGKRNSCLQAT